MLSTSQHTLSLLRIIRSEPVNAAAAESGSGGPVSKDLADVQSAVGQRSDTITRSHPALPGNAGVPPANQQQPPGRFRDTIRQIVFLVHEFPYVMRSRAREPASRRRSQDDPQMSHPSVASVSEFRGLCVPKGSTP
jgi:hypothetical protein